MLHLCLGAQHWLRRSVDQQRCCSSCALRLSAPLLGGALDRCCAAWLGSSLEALQQSARAGVHKCLVQGPYESRTIFESLKIAWSLLRIFPRELLRRVTAKTLDQWCGSLSVCTQLPAADLAASSKPFVWALRPPRRLHVCLASCLGTTAACHIR